MSKPLLPAPRSLTLDEVYNRLDRLFAYMDAHFTKERVDALTKMYTDLRPSLLTSPAAGKVQFHNAFPGGYLDHVVRVIDTALLVKRLYVHIGGVPDCTDAEIVFAAMHHDLGKLGDEDGANYIEETDSFWKKKGSYFDYNDTAQRMATFDRTVYLLQSYGVKFNKNEMLGMKMADGPFDPANATYFMAPNAFPHRTQIGYIIHWADFMSAQVEKDEVRKRYEQLNGIK